MTNPLNPRPPAFDPKAVATALVTLALAAAPSSTLAPDVARNLSPNVSLVDGDAWDTQLAGLNREQLGAVLMELANIAAVSIGNEGRLGLALFQAEHPDADAAAVARIAAALAPLPYWQLQLTEHHLHHGEDGATS